MRTPQIHGFLVLCTLVAGSTEGRGESSATPPPSFSHSGGFYPEGIDLELTADGVGADIRYTLDGSEPTANSKRFSGSIRIKSRAGEPNTLSLIPTVAGQGDPWLPPQGEVFKATVVTARQFVAGKASRSISHTYFVGPGMTDRYDITVMSLTNDPDHLFDPQTGIYVPGPDGNRKFYQRGRDNERPAQLELFEPGGQRAFALAGGIRLHGNSSRHKPIKPLRFYTRKQYGAAAIDYALFPDIEHRRFKRIILRNAGQDMDSAYATDVIVQRLFKNTAVETQSWRPSLLFINGIYWGLHHIRERYDDHYLKYTHGIERNAAVLLKGKTVKEGERSQATAYTQLLAYAGDNDLSVPDHYQFVSSRIDLDSYVDFVIAHVYSANQDWRQDQNIRQWRRRSPSKRPEAPASHDGRWRFMAFDFDASLRLADVEEDTIARARAQRLFGALVANPAFRLRFVERLLALLNGPLASERATKVIEEKDWQKELDVDDALDDLRGDIRK